jgi:hypothetical protein
MYLNEKITPVKSVAINFRISGVSKVQIIPYHTKLKIKLLVVKNVIHKFTINLTHNGRFNT